MKHPFFEWRSPFIHPPLNLHFSQRKLGKRPPPPPENFWLFIADSVRDRPPAPPKNLGRLGVLIVVTAGCASICPNFSGGRGGDRELNLR